MRGRDAQIFREVGGHMLVGCPNFVECSRFVSLSQDGVIEEHGHLFRQGPNRLPWFFTSKRCKFSNMVYPDLSKIQKACDICGRLLIPCDDQSLPPHYPDPTKTFSPDGYCGSGAGSGRGKVKQRTNTRYYP